MKLLFCERNLFMQRDIEDALTHMGIDFRCVSYVFNDPNRDDFYASHLRHFLSEDTYDAVLSVNVAPVIADVCQDMGIPYLAWCYDACWEFSRTDIFYYPTTYIFHFDRRSCEDYKQCGYSNIFHMPLAVNCHRLDQLCASAELVSSHPIATSIVNAAKERELKLERPQTFEEIAGEGLVVEVSDGKILCGNKKLLERFEIDFSVREEDNYGTEVLVARAGKYLGQIIIDDTLKEDAVAAVTSLKKMNLTTAMLTGDAAESAQAVARAAGIDEVRAKLMPQDKLNELGRLRKQYGGVMFVGDGINDAPVLAGADVGATMGSGADAAIEAADVVFMNSEMQAIPQAIALAKETTRIAWQNVFFALAIKIIIMAAGLAGYASMWAAVFADTGVSILCVLNSIRILYKKI